ncbi:pentatricopeptide repeat-containing protein At1g26460, mitochondrial isoform X2 [Daucus carota subsp. sativus]|uniref:pentatricopeptide repeat-containing protein At1g26460, mitochondrial isoform X2 n=1 Tax=Daucus carota subsp. sativus TaxID=79200 RepID=UPI003083C0F6
MAMNIIFNRSRPLLLRTLKPIFSKPISTSPFLSQQPQPLSPDPPTPAPSSQTSSATWTHPPGSTHSLVPLDFLQTHVVKLERIAESLDLESIKELFADWMTLQKWHDMKKVFEHWSSCYDKNGKLNKPDVGLYNHYLKANLMLKASPSQLLELVSGMESLGNLILKTMYLYKEVDTAVQLLDRMIESEKETDKGSEQDVVCRPDDESLDLESIKELFADWMTLQKWHDMKKVFEHWSSCYDKNGKLNKPDVGLYNHYLRANLMLKASPSQLLELVSGMESLGNLILKTMYLYKEVDTAVQLLDRLLRVGTNKNNVCFLLQFHMYIHKLKN